MTKGRRTVGMESVLRILRFLRLFSLDVFAGGFAHMDGAFHAGRQFATIYTGSSHVLSFSFESVLSRDLMFRNSPEAAGCNATSSQLHVSGALTFASPQQPSLIDSEWEESSVIRASGAITFHVHGGERYVGGGQWPDLLPLSARIPPRFWKTPLHCVSSVANLSRSGHLKTDSVLLSSEASVEGVIEVTRSTPFVLSAFVVVFCTVDQRLILRCCTDSVTLLQ